MRAPVASLPQRPRISLPFNSQELPTMLTTYGLTRILLMVMANENRAYPPEEPSRDRSRWRENPASERGKYGEQSLARNEQLYSGLAIVQSPKDARADPLIHFPSGPARESRNAYQTQPHDPSVEYQPPNPAMIAPEPGLSMMLLGATSVLVLSALLAWALFYNWMAPAPRSPQQQEQSSGLVQRIP